MGKPRNVTLLTGDPFSPQRAYEMGSINRIAPHWTYGHPRGRDLPEPPDWVRAFFAAIRRIALMERSAALQLLDSFPDQLVKFLRVRGQDLRPVLSKLRLNR